MFLPSALVEDVAGDPGHHGGLPLGLPDAPGDPLHLPLLQGLPQPVMWVEVVISFNSSLPKLGQTTKHVFRQQDK